MTPLTNVHILQLCLFMIIMKEVPSISNQFAYRIFCYWAMVYEYKFKALQRNHYILYALN